MTTRRSKKYSLRIRDFIRGSIVTTLPIYTVAFETLGFDFSNPNWWLVHKTAISTYIMYITKNYLSDEQGNILK